METKVINDLCHVEESILAAAKAATSNLENIDAQEFGEVTDCIKDLAEAKKLCWEAKYYHSVCDAMEKADHEREPDLYGYNPNRYASGRYAPKGRGERYGYDRPDYYDDYMRDGQMNENDGHMRMGYNPSKYGTNYDRYRDARRHYTETNKHEDLQKMNMSAKDHLDSVSDSLREMWNDANQTTRDQIKRTLAQLTNELN